jgi:hypothetical protein
MSEMAMEDRAENVEAQKPPPEAPRPRGRPRSSPPPPEAPADCGEMPGEESSPNLAFRRQAALAILGAFVSRHGGFNPADMQSHMRRVWEYADAFVRLEHAPPLPPPEDFDVLAHMTRPAVPGPRSSPADEWAVYDGNRRVTGFVSREEADFYAAARPGAKVVQIGGPGASAGRVADPRVTA